MRRLGIVLALANAGVLATVAMTMGLPAPRPPAGTAVEAVHRRPAAEPAPGTLVAPRAEPPAPPAEVLILEVPFAASPGGLHHPGGAARATLRLRYRPQAPATEVTRCREQYAGATRDQVAAVLARWIPELFADALSPAPDLQEELLRTVQRSMFRHRTASIEALVELEVRRATLWRPRELVMDLRFRPGGLPGAAARVAFGLSFAVQPDRIAGARRAVLDAWQLARSRCISLLSSFSAAELADDDLRPRLETLLLDELSRTFFSAAEDRRIATVAGLDWRVFAVR